MISSIQDVITLLKVFKAEESSKVNEGIIVLVLKSRKNYFDSGSFPMKECHMLLRSLSLVSRLTNIEDTPKISKERSIVAK